MPLDAEIYFWECPYKNSWQYHRAVLLKHIKGMVLLADLQNLELYKGMLLKAKLENFRFQWHITRITFLDKVACF